ncbi:MAG: flagellar type III secretion system pore protein FliP [Ilumatobacter sp.]
MTASSRLRRVSLLRHVVAVVVAILAVVAMADTAAAQVTPDGGPTPVQPIEPIEPVDSPPPASIEPGFPLQLSESEDNGNSVTLDIPGAEDSSNIVVIILVLTVLSVAPSILILMTSFTRIVIVLSLTRNALGVPQLPPQQVIVGLSIFLTLFVMGDTLELLNTTALQPLLDGEIEIGEALERAEQPIRAFMLGSTRESELELFLDAADVDGPVARDEVPLTALIPAFVLSELKSAFILGFVIFVPFLVIDLVTSAVLVSLGMMMLPPTFVSLPMKLLLFILLDGWTLVIEMLLNTS